MTALSNEQLINRLDERASRDGLTGLLNRTTFMEQAAREVRRLHNTGSLSTVILADLDNFKAVNDDQGHAAGDAAIRVSLTHALPRSVTRTWPAGTAERNSSSCSRAPARKALASSPKRHRHHGHGRPHRDDRCCGQRPLRGQDPRPEPDCHLAARRPEALGRVAQAGPETRPGLSTPPCAVPRRAPTPGCRRRGG